MDDPIPQLANYKLQLGQVEAVLTADPENQKMTNQIVYDHKKTANWRKGMTALDENAGTAKVTLTLRTRVLLLATPTFPAPRIGSKFCLILLILFKNVALRKIFFNKLFLL